MGRSIRQRPFTFMASSTLVRAKQTLNWARAQIHHQPPVSNLMNKLFFIYLMKPSLPL